MSKHKESQVAAILATELNKIGIQLETEYCFHDVRKWRFDIAIPSLLLAIEVHGRGSKGSAAGHQSAVGQKNDWEKQNAAIEAGWRVLVFPTAPIKLKKDGSPRNSLQMIIDQIYRIVCGIRSDADSAYVLTTHPALKRN